MEKCFYCLNDIKDGEDCNCEPFGKCGECGKTIAKGDEFCISCEICMDCQLCPGGDFETCPA